MSNTFTIGSVVIEGERRYYLTSPLEVFKYVPSDVSSTILQPRLMNMSPAEYIEFLCAKYDMRISDCKSFIATYFLKESEVKAHKKVLDNLYKSFAETNIK